MECLYCRTYNRKYYCSRCLTEKLSDHNDELQSITEDSQQAIKQAETFLDQASKVHALVVEKKRRSTNIEKLLDDQKHTTLETSKLTQQLEQLQKDMDQRRLILEQSRQRLGIAKTNMNSPILNESNSSKSSSGTTAAIQKSWQRTYKLTVRTRQILVKEAASLFDLKPGVVEDADDDDPNGTSDSVKLNNSDLYKQYQHPSATVSTDTHCSNTSEGKDTMTDPSAIGTYARSRRLSHTVEDTTNVNHLQSSTLAFTKSNKTTGKAQSYEDLYICGVTLPARLIDISRYPKDELNSAIGYTSQMLELIVRYLGIKLPFCLFRKDIYTYIRSIPHSRLYRNQTKMPLFLENDKNFRRFLIGISMLNYNIVYLCYTQGIQIPLSQVANTLQNLLTCCNAPGLGLRSHAMIYQGITNLDFSFDFNQVIRQTALRYRCGSRITIRGDQQGVNGEHTEKYFKVRRSAFLGDQYDDEDEDIDDEDDDTFDFTDEEYEHDKVDEGDDDDDNDQVHRNSHKQYYHRQHRRHTTHRHQDQGEEEANDPQDETTSSSNENWNLVDVMPAFATQSAHNDSIFHLGATHLGATIMPGVLGMMENLGGRHGHSSPSFGDHQDDTLSNYHGPPTLQKRW